MEMKSLVLKTRVISVIHRYHTEFFRVNYGNKFYRKKRCYGITNAQLHVNYLVFQTRQFKCCRKTQHIWTFRQVTRM